MLADYSYAAMVTELPCKDIVSMNTQAWACEMHLVRYCL